MGDPQVWQEIKQGLMKAAIYVCYGGIAVVAKLAIDSRGKPLSKREIAAKVALSIFGGVMCGTLCNKLGYKEWDLIATATGTYLGESLLLFVMTNWVKWADKLLPPFLKWMNNGNGHKKDEKKD